MGQRTDLDKLIIRLVQETDKSKVRHMHKTLGWHREGRKEDRVRDCEKGCSCVCWMCVGVGGRGKPFVLSLSV